MTIEEENAIYGLDYHARSLSSVHSDSNVQFLIGTQSLRSDNQVILLEFDEITNKVSRRSYRHNVGEIWQLKCSPLKPNLFITCYNSVQGVRCVPGCALWSYNETEDNTDLNLVQNIDVDGFSSFHGFQFQPADSGDNKALAIADNKIIIFDSLESGLKKCGPDIQVECKGQPKLTVAKWNPHNDCKMFAAANESTIRAWDTRSPKQPIWQIPSAHIPTVRDLEFNNNMQYYLATAGDDGKIKIWDTRSSQAPLVSVSRHSHWIWSIRFNPVHDQLMLSCSSDTRLVLHSFSSLSYEANNKSMVDDDDDDLNALAEGLINDGVIKVYDEHEESVYCAEWSVFDPWVFASLSYDGRVLISKVPYSMKDRILGF